MIDGIDKTLKKKTCHTLQEELNLLQYEFWPKRKTLVL